MLNAAKIRDPTWGKDTVREHSSVSGLAHSCSDEAALPPNAVHVRPSSQSESLSQLAHSPPPQPIMTILTTRVRTNPILFQFCIITIPFLLIGIAIATNSIHRGHTAVLLRAKWLIGSRTEITWPSVSTFSSLLAGTLLAWSNHSLADSSDCGS
jgi:hypothetical protein